MGPEVARGEPASILSDVYSLGAVLYTICCGRPPYRGSTVRETLEKVKEGPPPPPSQVLPHIPRTLEAITLKAIHRRPDQRYPSAEVLAEDLRRWLADEPVLAISDPFSVKVLRWAKKNRTQVQMVAGVIATALVGLVIGATLVWREKEQTEKQKVVAVANYQLARDLSQSSIDLMERSTRTEVFWLRNRKTTTFSGQPPMFCVMRPTPIAWTMNLLNPISCTPKRSPTLKPLLLPCLGMSGSIPHWPRL
jgi:serine/threonine protein kinase